MYRVMSLLGAAAGAKAVEPAKEEEPEAEEEDDMGFSLFD